MTEAIRVTVTLDEPMAARQARAHFHQDTHDHVPGTVFRGALAAAWIRHHGPPSTDDTEFAEIFEGEGSFGPLHSAASLPVPISVKTHKYEPSKDCKQLWWDRATDGNADICDCCGEKLESSKGVTNGAVARDSRTRASLDTSGVAEDGKLFNQSTLPARTRLHGWVYGPAVRALHLDGEPIDALLLGGGRSVRGRATVDLDTDTEPDPVEQDGTVIVLRLAGPGIFVDGLGMPSECPDTTELAEVLGVDHVDIEDKWTRWEEVGGWHAASGLPKPTERVIAAGSTYRLRCSETASEAARRTLMARGVGLRRREGFGALYRMPEPPRGLPDWKGTVAPLRGHKKFPILIRALRKRTQQVRQGRQDDSIFRQELDPARNSAKIIAALEGLLSVTDADRYNQILDYLEYDQ
ncbi:CRISPR-associated protein Csx10 [Saccharopolyspora lacisalsi]|uniref:CRISPR-associated protein Csx10 n=1 Tax=Halosaccharopolyspora lacisalsi TaxID=1000566 RepID=A0A839DYJ9_9PSEU|nr:type III-B CRISPR module-associated Cmr3 family protein [Halosaccharopolyspora lacisalsi]MBA8825286.1 CRISPR-associated protein Csx10 [Halosaccharopolyspora lacisalsi]